jgi:hypothetical protein
MSVWRDVWRDCVTANGKMAQSEEEGLIEFHKLMAEYGEDGMIHYSLGEAWEYRKNMQKAIKEYSIAKGLFPVDHWKNVAEESIERISKSKTPEQFYDKDDFEQLLWFGFQKVYEFVNLEDFVRYISLSAFSRASSEWPLALVDFRTVVELEIKRNFPEVIEKVKFSYPDYSLFNVIKELRKNRLIETSVLGAMDQIREAGNIAAHDAATYENDKFYNIECILEVLRYFNNYVNKNDSYFSEVK